MRTPGAPRDHGQGLHEMLATQQVTERDRAQIEALFLGIPDDVAGRLFGFFYTTSRGKKITDSDRAVGLYDPLADRRRFPAGVRYCINVYAGCPHLCSYCYTVNYVPEPRRGRAKPNFRKRLDRDLAELEALTAPVFPLHLSNSTDLFAASLETVNLDTRYTLEQVARHRKLFTSVTVLTKNPLGASSSPYVDLLAGLGATVEVSLAFWRDSQRRLLEPGAPTVEERLEGIRRLRADGLPVVLRLDPLFPRPPLPAPWWDKETPEAYGALTAHDLEDVDRLCEAVALTGVRKVVSKALKLPYGRNETDTRFKERFLPLFQAANGGKAIGRGSSWRLPDDYVARLWDETAAVVHRHGMGLVHCAHSLINTK